MEDFWKVVKFLALFVGIVLIFNGPEMLYMNTWFFTTIAAVAEARLLSYRLKKNAE